MDGSNSNRMTDETESDPRVARRWMRMNVVIGAIVIALLAGYFAFSYMQRRGVTSIAAMSAG
jgi:hypothetical protein